jgi:hypothetical protein
LILRRIGSIVRQTSEDVYEEALYLVGRELSDAPRLLFALQLAMSLLVSVKSSLADEVASFVFSARCPL